MHENRRAPSNPIPRHRFLAAILGTLLAGCASVDNSRWIPVSASFNNHPLRLIADTGAEDLIVWNLTAKRLGLSIAEPPPGAPRKPWQALAGQTGPGTLRIMGSTFQGVRMRTFDAAPFIAKSTGLDGVLGWANFKNNIFRIDAGRRRMMVLGKLPPGIETWARFPIRRQARVLEIEIPVGGHKELLLIDTGSEFGLELPPEAWRRWKTANPRVPATVDSYYTPAVGKPAVRELAWAPMFGLGPLQIRDLQIECHPVEHWEPVPHAGSIGMAGLERLECIVDGIHGWVYLRPVDTPAKPPNHNRLGATFHSLGVNGGELIAHVIPGGPAARTGIRDGDVLLKIGSEDLRDGRITIRPRDFLTQKAGTRVTLLLRRGSQVYQVEIVLEDVLGQQSWCGVRAKSVSGAGEAH